MFLFEKIKAKVRGVRHSSVEAMKAAVEHELKELHEDKQWWQAVFDALPRRWEAIVQVQGDYPRRDNVHSPPAPECSMPT